MSKAKKTAILGKQKAAAAAVTNRQMTPIGESAPMPKTAHAAKGKKQSRGK
jgi:hypothetical protein